MHCRRYLETIAKYIIKKLKGWPNNFSCLVHLKSPNARKWRPASADGRSLGLFTVVLRGNRKECNKRPNFGVMNAYTIFQKWINQTLTRQLSGPFPHKKHNASITPALPFQIKKFCRPTLSSQWTEAFAFDDNDQVFLCDAYEHFKKVICDDFSVLPNKREKIQYWAERRSGWIHFCQRRKFIIIN